MYKKNNLERGSETYLLHFHKLFYFTLENSDTSFKCVFSRVDVYYDIST